MLLNILNIYFFSFIILNTYLTAYIYQNNKSKYIKMLSLMFVTTLIYAFGYLMILNAKTLDNIIFWNGIQYLGVPFISFSWCMVVLLYTERIKSIISKQTFILAIIPFTTFFIRLTNDFHQLYYTSFEVFEKNGINLLNIGKGSWYYLYQSYHLLVIFTIMYLYFKEYKNCKNAEKKKYRIFIISSILPLFSVTLSILDPFRLGIDYSAMIMPIVITIFTYGIMRYDFLEVKTFARNEVFHESSEAIIILSRTLKILDYNKQAEIFFELLGMKIKNDRLEEYALLEPELYDLLIQEDKVKFKKNIAEEERVWEISTSIIKNKVNIDCGYVKYIKEITIEEKQNKILENLAKKDFLSNLYNRREFMITAEKIFKEQRGLRQKIVFIMIDIDDFKKVNDMLGHQAGDEVIRKVGALINSNFREGDLTGRIGGEEFAVILTNTDENKVLERAEELRSRVENTEIYSQDPHCRVTISIGIALSNDDADLEKLIYRADKALYMSKRTGKNKITFG